MRLRSALRQCFTNAMTERPLRPPPLLANLREPEPRGSLARDDHQIDARCHETRPEPEALSTEALHPVPGDGVANFLRHDDA
jgi:hypothetical protein